ncbi:MAG: ABC transporter substrate-binding protein, partial [Deltaproteobacteria bacterium]
MNAARPRLARGAALFLLLAACSQRTPIEVGSRAPAGRLVTATASDPRTFNPVLVTDQTSSQALADVFEPLVRTNPLTTEPEPVLADRWEWSGDGRACTFHLRDGVRWHDGRPFTSDDVVFTFEAIFDERVANSARFALTVDGQPIVVTAPDAATVRFSMPRPFAPFLAAVEVPILPRHVLGGSLADGSFSRRWGIDAKPAELVGTGPYRMKSYVPAQWIE